MILSQEKNVALMYVWPHKQKAARKTPNGQIINLVLILFI